MIRRLARLGMLLLAAVIVTACSGPAAPSAATVTTLPTPTTAAATDGTTVFVSPTIGYRVTLPCCWIALPASGAVVQAALDGVEDEALRRDLGELAARMRPDAIGAALELIAILPAASATSVPVAQLTVSVLPRAGLTPAAYLEATLADFAQIASSEVRTATVDPDLRADRVPAVVLEYAGAPIPGDTQVTLGMQVTLPAADGEHYVVLTFTTDESRYADLRAQFRDLAASVELSPSTP